MRLAAVDGREALQRADDDLLALVQRLRELWRLRALIGVDPLDQAGLMVDAKHRLLELGVEDAAVGDDDHAVEDAPVPRIVQPRQAVREPGDRVRLARPGRVLDEVVAPRPMRPRVRHQRGHGVELVVAREDHRLLHAQLARVVPLLVAVEEEKAVQDVEPAVAGPDLLPQIGGAVARRVVGVAGPARRGRG